MLNTIVVTVFTLISVPHGHDGQQIGYAPRVSYHTERECRADMTPGYNGSQYCVEVTASVDEKPQR